MHIINFYIYAQCGNCDSWVAQQKLEVSTVDMKGSDQQGHIKLIIVVNIKNGQKTAGKQKSINNSEKTVFSL